MPEGHRDDNAESGVEEAWKHRDVGNRRRGVSVHLCAIFGEAINWMTLHATRLRANARFNEAVNDQAASLLEEFGLVGALEAATRARLATPAGPRRVFAWNVELVCREHAGLPRPGVRSFGLGPDLLLPLLAGVRRLEAKLDGWFGKRSNAALLNESDFVAARLRMTERQLACLKFAAEGKSAKESARLFDPPLAPRTVEDHLHAVYTKLGANSKAQAVAIGREIGLLTEPP